MKKPGQRGERYQPRGQPYVPKRRTPAPSPSNFADLDASSAAGTTLAQRLAADPERVGLTVMPNQPDGLRPPFPSPFQWHPRESVVIPVLLTLAALGLIRQFPAEQPPMAVAMAGIEQGAAAPSATKSETELKGSATTGLEVTRIAILNSDALEHVPSVVAPLPEIGNAPSIATDVPTAAVAVRDVAHLGAVPIIRACDLQDVLSAAEPIAPIPAGQFGSALAAAAETQTREFVVYDDEYRVIRYPGGDVAALYGVCTDVIIRAYRALGVDLQKLVHESQIGSGDTNISHRRTVALRRFFAKAGASVPITEFAEDYLAGDIVTYHRPQNSGSNDHIAIVSNVTGPSGRPMIVHNRGFGPQIEDALFVDEITGHFRFAGKTVGAALGAPQSKASKRALNRSSGRVRTSVARLLRRSAILRAANKGGGKPEPKL